MSSEAFNPRNGNKERTRRTIEGREAILNPENLLQEFETNGVFSFIQDPHSGVNMRVVDEAALSATIQAIFQKAQQDRTPNYKQKLFAALPEAFGRELVLTKSNVESGRFMQKPFFYIPESSDKATDMVAIKNAEFHHFINDDVPNIKGEEPLYPTAEGASDVRALEAKTAALIFHPDYGDGFRNEKGQLFVRDKKTRKYARFSGDFLGSYGIHNREFMQPDERENPETRRPSRSMREGVTTELPHLVEKGLLRPVDDFKQQTYGQGSIAEQRVERAGVSSSGARMIHGVLHYIGRQFVDKQVRIVDISPTLGAVVDISGGVERVTHTFNLVPREQAIAGKSNMFLAGASLTQPKPFSADEVALPRREDESPEQFHDRIEKTDRGLAFLILHVFPKYPELSKMLRDRPTYEQASIAQAAYLLERDKKTDSFDEFVSTYGETGIRTFLVTGNNEQLREQVFDFARSVPHEQAQKVFDAYSSVIDSIDNLDSYLHDMFGTKDAEAVNQISTKILKRAEGILSSACAGDADSVVAVEAVRADAQLFLDSCRVLKSHGELSLEAIRDGSLEQVVGGQIPEEDKEKIIEIQQERYRGKYPEELLAELRQGLVSALNEPNSRFYMYRQHDQIVSTVRFDENAQGAYGIGKHMASFITNRRFEGGALGQALLEAAIREERANGPVYAECDPSLVPFYERFGFKIARGPYTDDHGVATCDIELPSSVSVPEDLRKAA